MNEDSMYYQAFAELSFVFSNAMWNAWVEADWLPSSNGDFHDMYCAAPF